MFHVPYHRDSALHREAFSDASVLQKNVIIISINQRVIKKDHCSYQQQTIA